MDDNQIIVSVLPPASCAASNLIAYRSLVTEGGEVAEKSIGGLISKALVLGYGHANGVLVGVGAIKRPNTSYRNKMFANANSSSNPTEFEFELGWFYVRPDFRGKNIASKLIKKLVGSLEHRPAYATSRANNQYMHALLHRNGFIEDGQPYASAMHQAEIQLFLRHSK